MAEVVPASVIAEAGSDSGCGRNGNGNGNGRSNGNSSNNSSNGGRNSTGGRNSGRNKGSNSRSNSIGRPALGSPSKHHVAPRSSTSPQETKPPPSLTEIVGAPGRRPGKRPAARGTAFYPRKRANTACQVCRARKTKCDNMKPSCTYCLSVGAACIQSPVDLSSFDPASLKILDRLDELEYVVRSLSSHQASESSASYPHLGPASLSLSTDASARGVGHPGGAIGEASGSQPPPPLPESLPLPFPLSPLPAMPDAGPMDPTLGGAIPSQPQHELFDEGPDINSILPQRVDHILQWPSFANTHSYDLSPISYRAPPDAMSTPPASSASLAALCDMESPRIYRLLNNFFLHIHCKNPILDEASAREVVLDAFLNGMDWSPASCLAMIICALGCIATPFGPSTETKVGTQAYIDSQVFFHAAQKRIGTLLVRSDIVGAQCLFLSGIYLMMVFQPIYAWRFFSQALAACQHFSFLAKAQNDHSSTSPASMEMGRQDTQEQALYWSAWKSERELRQELDLPDFDMLNLGNTLYPPFFPAPPSQPANTPEGPDSEAQRARSSWMFYLAEISLRRLTNRLSSELMGLREGCLSNSKLLDALADMLPEYEAQVREWSDSLPADLSVDSPVEEDGICRSVLRGRMINLLETIYWPFVVACISSHETRRPIKQAAAALATRGLETHMLQIHVNKPGFHHRHHGAYFMIRACTRSALVLLAAAKAGCPMPLGWDDSVYQVVGVLAYWEDEDRDLLHWRSVLEQALTLSRIG